MTEIADRVDRAYPVDGAFQPLHPDMIVPKKRERKATKGRYAPYNMAAIQTESAIDKTGKAIAGAVKVCFALTDEEASQKLHEAISKSGLGLAAAADKQYMMNIALATSNPAPERPVALLLSNYCSNYIPNIDHYLKKVKDYALFEGREMLYASLKRAYERIDTGYFEKQMRENNDKLKQILAILQNLYNADDFYSKADNEMLSLTSTFSADGVNEAESKSFFLLRGEDQLKRCQSENIAHTTKYYIDETTGNIQELDDAPMKVIRLTLLDCTKQNLETLIRG